MRTIAFEDLQNRLAENLGRVVDDHDPLFVTHAGEETVVILSAADYRSHIESVGLLKDPEDAAKTRRALADYAAGRMAVRELVRDPN